MGRGCFDEYMSEIENGDVAFSETAPGEVTLKNELDQKASEEAQRRKAVEQYQERMRLRHDLEFFT